MSFLDHRSHAKDARVRSGLSLFVKSAFFHVSPRGGRSLTILCCAKQIRSGRSLPSAFCNQTARGGEFSVIAL